MHYLLYFILLTIVGLKSYYHILPYTCNEGINKELVRCLAGWDTPALLATISFKSAHLTANLKPTMDKKKLLKRCWTYEQHTWTSLWLLIFINRVLWLRKGQWELVATKTLPLHQTRESFSLSSVIAKPLKKMQKPSSCHLSSPRMTSLSG